MTALRNGQRACIIGAGSSGITACQVLDARGIPFDCFEKGSGVGGNWRYENDNGMSSAYRSLHINTSRPMMAYAAYPMPEDYPDYPSHWQIAQLLRRLRRPLRPPRADPLPHRGAVGRARGRASGEVTVDGTRGGRGDQPLRRGHRRQRPPLGPALARARPSRAPTTSTASRSTSTTTASPTSSRASGCWCSGSATPPPTSPSRPRGSPTRPSWRCAAAPTSSPSTSAASPPTRPAAMPSAGCRWRSSACSTGRR